MRTIEFRGYSPDRGWVFGDLLQRPNGDVYINERSDSGFLSYLVRPETVGQYTGLEDGLGNKVYEGDIVEFARGGRKRVSYVSYKDGVFRIGIRVLENGKVIPLGVDLGVEVIGNIHDTPELLER